MAKIQNPTKVITGVNTRWSYANVWDAKSINGGAPKYSVSLIIPKRYLSSSVCQGFYLYCKGGVVGLSKYFSVKRLPPPAMLCEVLMSAPYFLTSYLDFYFSTWIFLSGFSENIFITAIL